MVLSQKTVTWRFLSSQKYDQVHQKHWKKSLDRKFHTWHFRSAELQNVIFTQIISALLNLPQEKVRKLRKVFDI